MKPIVLRILGCIFLAGAIIAMFLPVVESFVEGNIHRPLSIISVRPNPHQGGMFGGGFYTTYNGFGSLTALFNCFISLLLLVSIFRSKAKKNHFRILLTLSISSQVLLLLNMILMPFMLNPSDKLLIGYFLLTACEIGLFILLCRHIERDQSESIKNSSLLDWKTTVHEFYSDKNSEK